MLIITRRPGERLVLGEDVRIEVIESSAQGVRLGIDAPRSVTVYREELWEAVKAENEAAARSAAGDNIEMPRPTRTPPRDGTQ